MKLESRVDGSLPKAVEKPSFIPIISIKPHHLTNNSEVQKALIPEGKSEALLFPSPKTHADMAYMADLMGTTRIGKKEYEAKTKDYLNQLRDLADDTFIHIDLARDGVCKAACVGKHCTATNYRSGSSPMSTLYIEMYKTKMIREHLERLGYKEGDDFISKITEHVLYDLHGETLDTPNKGTPTPVKFDSLVVRTPALRRLAFYLRIELLTGYNRSKLQL